MKKKIHFSLPTRIETFLLVTIVFLLFLADISLHKAADFGLDYKVTVFSGLQIKAIILFWVGIILYHILLVVLISRALLDRGTHHFYDAFTGIFILFGVAVILSGALFHFNPSPIPVFNIVVSVIDFYHFGIALQVIGLIYYSLTD